MNDPDPIALIILHVFSARVGTNLDAGQLQRLAFFCLFKTQAERDAEE